MDNSVLMEHNFCQCKQELKDLTISSVTKFLLS